MIASPMRTDVIPGVASLLVTLRLTPAKHEIVWP